MVHHIRYSQYDLDATKSRTVRLIADKLKLRDKDWQTDAEILFWIEVIDKKLSEFVEDYFLKMEEWYIIAERFERNGAQDSERPEYARKHAVEAISKFRM